jgi:D-glycero-alpha-D-manno-heptose-7-phosphate kinase
LVDELYESIKQSDIQCIGEILHKGWQAKKRFAKGITNKHIDKVYESALKAGAIGGKLTGAGGGGHMLLYCEKAKRKNVIQTMTRLGLRHVPFNFHYAGPKVLNLYDYNK